MDKPILYRFKFNEENGKLESEAIKDYKEVIWYDKKEYRYKLLGSVRVVKAGNIDKYTHEQVHSFNPNIDHARRIILDAIKAKYCKACEDQSKYIKILSKLERFDNEMN